MAEQKHLKGMTWSDPRGYDPLVAASIAFRTQHPNVDIIWDKRSLQEFESTPVEDLACIYDLIIIDHPHVGAIVEKNCLLPLDQFAAQDALTRLSAETIGKSYQSYFYQRHQWALPVDAACQVQAIRPDLLPAPVSRFKDVLSQAQQGRVVWPLRAPHILMSFFTLMANCGAPFPVTAPTSIDQKTARDVIEAMQALNDLIDPTCLEMDPIAALDALCEDDCFSLSPFVYLYAPYGRAEYRKHRIAFHDMPSIGTSGPLGSALGGTGLAVSARTSYPDLCAEFALWVASADLQRGLYANHNGQPGNAVAWGDSSVNQPVGNAYNNTRMTHEAAWLRPRHAGYMGFQEQGSEIVLNAITRKIHADTAISALQKCFDESLSQ